MADANDKEVNVDTERVEVKPSTDDETIEPEGDETETPPESSPAETSEEGAASEEDETPEPEKKPQSKPAAEVPPVDGSSEIKQLPGESPREFALRLEITRLKRNARQEKAGEIFQPKPAEAKQEIAPEKKKVLDRYKPEEVSQLKEVFDVLADEMGFVRKDQLGATTYNEKANDELNSFLEAHPEYLPENDTDNILWNRFKEEYGMYKQPTNPKDFKKIFNKAHEAVFGIKPAGDLKKSTAAAEKIKVASHASTSKPLGVTQRRQAAPSGLRLDMLKGFDDDFIDDLQK